MEKASVDIEASLGKGHGSHVASEDIVVGPKGLFVELLKMPFVMLKGWVKQWVRNEDVAIMISRFGHVFENRLSAHIILLKGVFVRNAWLLRSGGLTPLNQ